MYVFLGVSVVFIAFAAVRIIKRPSYVTGLPAKYQNHEWTRDFIYHMEMARLIVGVCWLPLAIICCFVEFQMVQGLIIFFFAAVPGLIYEFVWRRKYRAMIKKGI